MTVAEPSRSFLSGPGGLLRALRRRGDRAAAGVTDRIARKWLLAVLPIVALVSLPVVAVLVLAVGSDTSEWPHLARNVLPAAFWGTLWLLLGTAVLTAITGTGAAWLVTMYRFPGRGLVDRLLVLPLAIPTYIVAYAYVELLDYAGWVQTAMRAVFGWTGPRDYWFPEIRSTYGAVVTMAAVLYPYVYLSARASFVQQSVCALEVARTLGRTPLGVLRDVALPLARPAIAAGTALVLMECLNDIGAVQYLGVQTLSSGIYATWLQRGSLAGAVQLALVLLVFVAVLIAFERSQRGGGRFHHTTGRYRAIPFQDLVGWRGWMATATCLVPVTIGFILPIVVLLRHAFQNSPDALEGHFWVAARNSVVLAGLAAAAAVFVALLLAYAQRMVGTTTMRFFVRVSGLGYALPGTLLALGLMIPLAAFDNALDAVVREMFGFGIGLLLSGSVFAVTLAYCIRFLAVALGSLEAGLERISPNLDAAARTLGLGTVTTLRRVHIPLLVPAIGAAGLLVFVDCMKELPATLLLRPFNFETLATEVYNLAALEQLEVASLSALAIVGVGLLPVLLLHRAIAGGRAGSR